MGQRLLSEIVMIVVVGVDSFIERSPLSEIIFWLGDFILQVLFDLYITVYDLITITV